MNITNNIFILPNEKVSAGGEIRFVSNSAGFVGKGSSGAISGLFATAKSAQSTIFVGFALEKGEEIATVGKIRRRHRKLGECDPNLSKRKKKGEVNH